MRNVRKNSYGRRPDGCVCQGRPWAAGCKTADVGREADDGDGGASSSGPGPIKADAPVHPHPHLQLQSATARSSLVFRSPLVRPPRLTHRQSVSTITYISGRLYGRFMYGWLSIVYV